MPALLFIAVPLAVVGGILIGHGTWVRSHLAARIAGAEKRLSARIRADVAAELAPVKDDLAKLAKCVDLQSQIGQLQSEILAELHRLDTPAPAGVSVTCSSADSGPLEAIADAVAEPRKPARKPPARRRTPAAPKD